MRHIVVILICLMAGASSQLYSQSKDTVIIRKFTQKDGLTSYNIRKIIQDKWGFLWIATQDGISRFDGKSFVNYTKNGLPSKRLCGSDVKELIEDTIRNVIWALSSQTGFNTINTLTKEVERTIAIPGLGKEDYILSMLMCANELWIGTSTSLHVFACDKNRFVQDPIMPETPTSKTNLAIRSILKDENGNVWVCYGGYGIVIYQGSTKAILRTIRLAELNDHKRMNEIRISCGIFTKKGNLILATSQGLREISYNNNYEVRINNTPCYSFPALNLENIDWIACASNNALLVAGYGGLYHFDRSLSQYKVLQDRSRTCETDWLSSVLFICQDKKNDLWLGCQEGLGYISGVKTPFKAYNNDPLTNVKLNHVFAVSPIQANNILVGLRNGLVEIDSRSGIYKLYDNVHLYQHIFTDKKGIIHLSRPDGLFIYHNDQILPVDQAYPEFRPYSSFSINSHLFINDTLIILGTENNKGILIWNPVKQWVKNINAGSGPVSLASDIVNKIFQDSQGRIWVLSDNVITLLSSDLSSRREVMLNEQNTGDPYNLFFDMCEADGSYWIAAYGSGILQVGDDLVVKQVFNTRTGLSNDGVYQIYPLPNNALLVTSNNGLSRIDLKQGKVSRYYLNNGLHDNAFEEVSGTAANGKIYAGGPNGFTVIDPSHFSVNSIPPKLYIEGIETRTGSNFTADTSNLQMQAMTIQNDVVQTTIRFAGLNYTNPERTEYAYRIAEESEQWINNGAQNFISLISHLPGTYTLLVKAANEDGLWSAPIELKLYFQPKWYQTYLFRAIVAILFIAVVYQLYQFRIRQFRREEIIRRRLARDLHDDLGSTMNSVNIYTNLAIMENGKSRYLDQIKQGAQEAMAGIRDIIWILDDQRDTIGQLAQRITQFAHPLCEANGISFTLNVDPALAASHLGKEEKRNLHMILKEAINNSLKYANAKSISINFRNDGKKLMIVVADDGKGFDQAKASKGNGLSNMERRAIEINYNFAVSSKVGRCTIIQLKRQ